MYQTRVFTAEISVSELISRFYKPQQFLKQCKQCKNFNRVWSCPPLSFQVTDFLSPYTSAVLIGTQILYDMEDRMRSRQDGWDLEKYLKTSYYQVKHQVLETLADAEGHGESLIIGASECDGCAMCSRVDGEACRKKTMLHYSFAALGFDLGAMAKELFQVEMEWANIGLPSYHMIMNACLTK